MTLGGLVLARRVGGAATALVAIVAQSVGLLVPTSGSCSRGAARGSSSAASRTD